MSCPPAKPPKPGKVKVYKALFNYAAQQADELGFSEGDILYILEDNTDKSGSGWWQACCHGKSGLVPCNYIAEQAESISFPLHEAAKRGNMDFLQDCLKNGVSVNSLDKSGSTSVYWASHSGHIDVLRQLLSQNNVNVNAQNKLGDSALHAAAWKGHGEAVELLLQAGAKTNVQNHENQSPFDLAKEPNTAAALKRASATQPQLYADDYVDSDED